MPRITSVKFLHGYVLLIGLTAEVDLGDELEGPIFAPLRDFDLFSTVRLNPDVHTAVWPNGADFAPEFLWELATTSTLRLEPAGRVFHENA
jgi:hypothetical protein